MQPINQYLCSEVRCCQLFAVFDYTKYSAISECTIHHTVMMQPFIHFHQTCQSPPQWMHQTRPQISLGIHEKFFQT